MQEVKLDGMHEAQERLLRGVGGGRAWKERREGRTERLAHVKTIPVLHLFTELIN